MFEKYYKPVSLEEALSRLDDSRGRARIIAGGTDLVLQLQNREIVLDAVVDITAIEQLRYIREEGGMIKIGALTTHSDMAGSPLLKRSASLLSEAAGNVGSLQIRNVGTVGGNVINAQPAADTAVALMALDAMARVVSTAGERQVPLGELYRPEGGTALDPGREIVTEFSFYPPANGGGSGAFNRLARRKAVALPVFNTAVVIWTDQDQSYLTDARIIMGPVARIPFRAREAEKVLTGNPPGEHYFRLAAAQAAGEAKPRDSYLRGSAAYRKKLAQVMVLRALTKAWDGLEKRG
jgi:carbon-monoxide dehydrogenase medium subunit